MIIFIGAQAAGKSSYYKFRYSDSHIRVNLDMLRTRNREQILITACLKARQPFVIDNTNASKLERKRYFRLALEHECLVSGFYFQSKSQECLTRNRLRDRSPLREVPDLAIRNTISRLELPSFEEGFNQLHFVRMIDWQFFVEEWQT